MLHDVDWWLYTAYIILDLGPSLLSYLFWWESAGLQKWFRSPSVDLRLFVCKGKRLVARLLMKWYPNLQRFDRSYPTCMKYDNGQHQENEDRSFLDLQQTTIWWHYYITRCCCSVLAMYTHNNVLTNNVLTNIRYPYSLTNIRYPYSLCILTIMS